MRCLVKGSVCCGHVGMKSEPKFYPSVSHHLNKFPNSIMITVCLSGGRTPFAKPPGRKCAPLECVVTWKPQLGQCKAVRKMR